MSGGITIISQSKKFWEIDIPGWDLPSQYEHLLRALEEANREPGYFKKGETAGLGVTLVPPFELYRMIVYCLSDNGYKKFTAQYSDKLLSTYYPNDTLRDALKSILDTLLRMRSMDEFGVAFWNGYIFF